jgi:hypothetical protein
MVRFSLTTDEITPTEAGLLMAALGTPKFEVLTPVVCVRLRKEQVLQLNVHLI